MTDKNIKQMTELVRLDIQEYDDRRDIVGILTDNGYPVEVKKTPPEPHSLGSPSYEIVVFKKTCGS